MSSKVTWPSLSTEMRVQEGQYSRVLYHGCPQMKDQILAQIEHARQQSGQFFLQEGLSVNDSTGLMNTGSQSTMGSWKLSLLFRTAPPEGVHRCCPCDSDSVDPEHSTAQPTRPGRGPTTKIPQPDLAVIFYCHESSLEERAAQFDLSSTLSGLGIPTIEIVARTSVSDLSFEHDDHTALKSYFGLQHFLSLNATELHQHLVETIKPYAEKASKAAWACRNQAETYEGAWWGEADDDGDEMQELSETRCAVEDDKKMDISEASPPTKMFQETFYPSANKNVVVDWVKQEVSEVDKEEPDWDEKTVVLEERDVEKGGAPFGGTNLGYVPAQAFVHGSDLRRRRLVALVWHSVLVTVFFVGFFGADAVRRIQEWLD